METSRLYSVKLPSTLLGDLLSAAQRAGVTPAEFIRSAIGSAVRQPRPNPASDRQDKLIDLVSVFETSTDWFTLQSGLRARGYVLREGAGGRLMVHSWPIERALIPLSHLAQTEEALCLRFRAPFPAVPDLPGGKPVFSGRARIN